MNPYIAGANGCIRKPVGAFCALAVITAIALAGCAGLGRAAPLSRMLAPNELQANKATRIAQVNEVAWPSAAWWEAFGDPQLDRLERAALAGNPTLSVARSRVDRARAFVGTRQAQLRPELDAQASATRERFSANGLIPPPYGGTTQSEGQFALELGYEFDFWGAHRAALAAALDRAEAAHLEELSAGLILSAAVAHTYVQLSRIYDRLDVAHDELAQRQQIFHLTNQRVMAGIDARVELKQAEARVPEAREAIAALEESLALARHRLAALVGRGPDDGLALERPKLHSTGGEAVLPSRLPADLLGRRPDLQASRLRVAAAERDVKVARAQFYPNVDLLAFAGFQSIGLSQLLEAGSGVAGIGPALHLPLFEGGRLRSQLAGASADYDAAVEQYNDALLESLREIADVLAGYHSVATQRRESQLALAAARESYELSLWRYRQGVGDYLSVLSAETLLLQQRETEADLRARELDEHIDLVRSLGGGVRSDTEELK